MPKTASLDLHLLIHSLTVSEVRYFKKFATRYCEQQHQYLHLFDAIYATKAYSEESLMAVTKIANKQRFAEQKIYLYNNVLDALAEYHKEKRIDFQLRDMITKATILVQKNLFAQSFKIIETARQLATEHDVTFYINELFALEAPVKFELFDEPDMPQHFAKLFAECRTHHTKVDFFLQLLEIRYLLASAYNKYGLLANMMDAKNLAYCQRQIAMVRENELTALEKIIHYSNLVFLFSMLHRKDDNIDLNIEARQIFEKNPSRIAQHRLNYLYMLYSGITQLLVVGKLEEAREWINYMHTLSKDDVHYQHNYFIYFIRHSIDYFNVVLLLKQGEIGKAFEQIHQQGHAIRENFNAIPERLLIRHYYLHAQVCFFNHQYDEALDWIEKVIGLAHLRLDMQVLARMFEILCHYETDNLSLIEHKMVALERYVKKNCPMLGQVKLFARLMRQMIRPLTQTALHTILRNAEKPFIDICKEEALDGFGFDVVLWVINKVHRMDYSESIPLLTQDVSVLKNVNNEYRKALMAV
jgi:hypothetical protein